MKHRVESWLLLFVSCFVPSVAFSGDCNSAAGNDRGISSEVWSSDTYTKESITDNPTVRKANDDECGGNDFFFEEDRVIIYDINKFQNNPDLKFDFSRLKIDGDIESLKGIENSFLKKGFKRIVSEEMDFCTDKVKICVGSSAECGGVKCTDEQLKSVFLWYKNSYFKIPPKSDMDQAFDDAYSRYGNLGDPTSGTYCWSESSNNQNCTDGVWIRKYNNGSKETALIYNPYTKKGQNVYLMSEVFWAYYQMISGYKVLGAPINDAYIHKNGYRQDFNNGYIIWSPDYECSYWNIIVYNNKGAVIIGTSCFGPGTSTQPTDPPTSGKLPDFITNKVILANESGSKEKYTWKVNETAYVHSWTDNIGKKDWEGKAKKIIVPFYLSKGTKEDSHSTWVRAGREEIKKDNLDVKDKPKHEKIAFSIRQWAAAGYIYPGRTYNFVVCADRPNDQDNGDGDVKEVHKSNNCSTPAVFYVDYGPARNVDVMASNLALAGGKSSLQAGEAYGFQADISNIGTQYPWNGCRTNYEIKGPGTGDVWQKVADEGSTVAQLGPNSTHVEVIDESRGLKAPSVGGDYVFRACADYEQAIPETDESNNCTAELPVTVEAPLPPPPPSVTPRIVITNPTRGEDWRSDERKHIEWTYDDFPSSGKVKIEYSMDGGASWQTIEESTTNDGGRYWEMCDFHTVDSHHSYIRITSVEYPEATDMSDEFSIDHAKECK